MIFFDGSFFEASGFYGAVKRSSNYGDGIFETCLLVNGNIPLWSYHVSRMVKSTSILKMDWQPEKDQMLLEKDIKNMLPLLGSQYPGHNIFRLRVNLARAGEGKYLPQSNSVVRWLEVEPFNETYWSANTPAFRIALNPENVFVQTGLLAGLKTMNSLPYIMASIYKQQLKLDETILQNPHGRIADCSAYAIYIIEGNTIKSPSVFEGAVDSVSRRFIMEHLPEHLNFTLTAIHKNDLHQAKAVFLSNALRGIIPVAEMEGRALNTTLVIPLIKHYGGIFANLTQV